MFKNDGFPGETVLTDLVRRTLAAFVKGFAQVCVSWDQLGAHSRRLIKWTGNRSNLHGAIAQLGERIVRNDEVVGSIPTSSTNLLNILAAFCSGHLHDSTGELLYRE